MSLRAGFLNALILTVAAPCFAIQAGAPEEIFTLSIAPPTLAKDVQVRYVFTGEFGGYGSSTADQGPGEAIVIRTGVQGKSAKTFKLIAYAPGCQLVLLTVDDLGSSDRQGQFQCQQLPTLQLHGRMDILDFTQKDLQVQVLYV